jgi:hypothetical protein
MAEQPKHQPQRTPRIQADKIYPIQTAEQQRYYNMGRQGHTSYIKIRIQDTNFLLENNFQKTTTDATKSSQTQIRKTIKDSKTLIPQGNRWKYVNLNPSAPSIKGLVKIHKPDQPIRPIVISRHAPVYKLSKLFTNKIIHIASLPNAFNVKNTKELIQNFKVTPWIPHFTFASLVIKNLYPNIPVKETKTI